MLNLRKTGISFFMAFMLLGGIVYKSGNAAVEPVKKQEAPASSPALPQKMIWDYKNEVGLTDPQVANIKQAISDFEKNVIRIRSQLQIVELDVQNLIQKKADLESIRAKLKESADLQIEVRLADIGTARKIDETLTPEQAMKWKEIQKKEAALSGGGTKAPTSKAISPKSSPKL